MFQVLEGETADELWMKAAGWFEPGAIGNCQESRCGDMTEVLHAALSLSKPTQRWVASRSPAMNPAFALAEVIWIMNGRNDSAFVNYFNPILPNFAGNTPVYHGAYGFRLRKHFGIDQLDRAYRALSANQDSRQIVLQIWDCAADLPGDTGEPRADDIPCNTVSLLKVRDGRLEWTQIMRSNDLVRGMPHNIVQFTCLQEILAGWLGVDLGGYHHFADSLHFYDRDAPISERVEPQLLPDNDDSIAFKKELSERYFLLLGRLGDSLASTETDIDGVLKAFHATDLPQTLRNWAALLTVDALRRRAAYGEIEAVAGECTNDCLARMLESWLQRNATG